MVIGNSVAIALKKIAAVVFIWPLVGMFYVVFANNPDASIRDMLIVIPAIIIGSLGLPIWTPVAAQRMFFLQPKGDHWVRYLSVMVFLGFLVRHLPEPSTVASSDAELLGLGFGAFSVHALGTALAFLGVVVVLSFFL